MTTFTRLSESTWEIVIDDGRRFMFVLDEVASEAKADRHVIRGLNFEEAVDYNHRLKVEIKGTLYPAIQSDNLNFRIENGVAA